MKGLPTIESLEATHDFPCRYIIKVIGANTDAFQAAARHAADEVSGYPDTVRVSTRVSSRGNHRAVTLDVYMQSAHQVQALYVELSTIEGLTMML